MATKVEIKTDRFFLGFLKYGRTYTRDLPSSWQEVPEKLRPALLSVIGRYRDRLVQKVEGLRALLNIPDPVYYEMPAELRKPLIDQLDWLDHPVTPEPLIPEFKLNGKRYLMPAPHGKDLNALEVAIAEEFFKKIIDNPDDPEGLIRLLAVIANEADSEGIRQNHKTRKEITDKIPAFKQLDPEIASNAFFFATAFFEFVHETYADLFKKDGDKESETGNFGWWGIFMDVAESGTFGNFKDVQQENFHVLALYLVKRTREAREREREMQRQRMKNK